MPSELLINIKPNQQALHCCVLKRGKLFRGGRFMMCFMAALSGVDIKDSLCLALRATKIVY